MKKWLIKEVVSENVAELMEKYKTSRLAATILANRTHILSDNPFNDPFLMKDMQRCVDRINLALENNEQITIYGDFDVDGVTSTTILYLYLESKGANVKFYIPDRVDEGYGINLAALKTIKQSGTSLVITVDTGITAVNEIAEGIKEGLDIIITDHHEPKETIPECVAVVNPKQANCPYSFKDLAGVGVAFKLIQALEGNQDSLNEYMPLVCLGTIADIVPLVGENRTFAKLGLKNFAASENPGIQALIKAANLEGKPLTSSSIGFGLAPRINAAGRLGSANKCVEMFICKDHKTAAQIARTLNEENQNRQKVEQEIFKQAIDIIETEGLYNDKVIVVAHRSWHQGVIGIVASKIAERFCKPSILIALDDTYGKGSGRSIGEFNLFEALCACEKHLVKFGGHTLAAGLTILTENVSLFRDALNIYAPDLPEYIPTIHVDSFLEPDELTFETVRQLRRLEPYGSGNPTPMLAYLAARITLLSTVSDGKHLRLTVERNGHYLDTIGFGLGDSIEFFNKGDIVDIVGILDINTYQEKQKLQLTLKDIRKTGEFHERN